MANETIYTRKDGTPIEKPSRLGFFTDYDYICAMHEYKREIEREASRAVYHKR